MGIISAYSEYINLETMSPINVGYYKFRMQTDQSIGPNCSFELCIILSI